ncbi:hypothetical protein HHI36_016141 [Cryptolaemus montrouzieri]|uniref:Uncharacterized protein n=1 Tax=Cryptolaemus montrouzieri TaxID=559131 RepID=A0ABD2NJ85_9CUCU
MHQAEFLMLDRLATTASWLLLEIPMRSLSKRVTNIYQQIFGFLELEKSDYKGEHRKPPNNNIDDEVPTLDEVQNALKRLRKNRAPGKDSTSAELLYVGEGLTDITFEHR